MREEIRWVAAIKSPGVSPSWALETALRNLGSGEGLLFVGPSGLLIALQRSGNKAVRSRVLRPVEGEDARVTAARAAGRVAILTDDRPEGENPALRLSLQERKPVDVLRRGGRSYRYRDGQLVPPAGLLAILETEGAAAPHREEDGAA